ncbi:MULTISPECIES: PadR family transcriptional regulator [Mycetocola]|uniref:PadR family transcriptional regulator n=1 Tax=Mycetocola TaxID=76634 RepID=UPI0004BEE16E|nr:MULTISPECIES: PadR family transcriptional regulator [Mycetocola]MCS4277350.1 PadR family transcriptional regulator PadR [Mycetocola sp. BIGb0189]
MSEETEAVLVQLRKGVLEYCVLACLRGGPAYGLELAQRLAPHRALFANAGTLYPLLSRLKKQDRVETYWEESSSGPPRQYYRLSPSGTRALEAFELVWGRFNQDVETVLGGESV